MPGAQRSVAALPGVARPLAERHLRPIPGVELPLVRLLKVGVALVLAGNALGAYNIGPFPIQWLAQVLAVLLSLLLVTQRALPTVPGVRFLHLLLLWSAAATVLNTLAEEELLLVQLASTTPYPVYVALRFLNLVAAIATVYLVYTLVARGEGMWLLRAVTAIAAAVALAAAYIYLAQIYGLPEPPRSRMGTGGADQAIQFDYAFHRAMGTFREPSHLAEWMVVPFFASLILPGLLARATTMLVAAVILLTGSLTGIVGAAIGFALASLVTNPLRRNKAIIALQLAVVIGLAFGLFRVVAVTQSSESASLGQVLAERLAPFVNEGGIMETNRGYVYEYVGDTPPPVFGFGVGNANLLLGEYLGIQLVPSFLSLYLNVLYSSGLIGLALLVLVLALPVAGIWRSRRLREDRHVVYLLSAYFAWLVMYAVHSEEFSTTFALAYGFLAYLVGSARPRAASAGA